MDIHARISPTLPALQQWMCIVQGSVSHRVAAVVVSTKNVQLEHFVRTIQPHRIAMSLPIVSVFAYRHSIEGC
jgi:hypothetical protein